MMITCNVIQDLLPLYVEDMLSEDSRKIVESHLDCCPDCLEELKLLKEVAEIPVEKDGVPLLKIREMIQKKRIQTGLFFMGITFFLCVLLGIFLTAPDYLPYNQTNLQVVESNQNTVFVEFSDSVAGFNLDKAVAEDGSSLIYHITTWQTPWNKYIGKKTVKNTLLNPRGEHVQSVYYYQNNYEDQLIYGENTYSDGGVQTLPRLFLAYYAITALLVTIVSGICVFLPFKNKKMFSAIFLAGVSYLLGQLIVKGFSTTTYSPIRDFSAILLVAFSLYLLILGGNYLWQKKKVE